MSRDVIKTHKKQTIYMAPLKFEIDFSNLSKDRKFHQAYIGYQYHFHQFIRKLKSRFFGASSHYMAVCLNCS